MRRLFLLSLFLPITAMAITTAKESGRAQLNICQVRARYIEPVYKKIPAESKGRAYEVDSVHWRVEVVEVSDRNKCPGIGALSVRVRGALVDAKASPPKIIYQMDITEPAPGALADLKLEYSEGKDTLTKVDFQEWFLRGVGND